MHIEEFKGVHLTSKFPRSQSSICGMCKEVQYIDASPHDLQDLLLILWCQNPQHTFKGVMESMARQVRLVLAVQGGPTQY